MGPKKRNREEERESETLSKKRKTKQDNAFLSKCSVFILKAGIEKTRIQIFQTQILNYGGNVSEELSDNVTHIIVDDKMDIEKMCRLLRIKSPPNHIPIIKSNWLSTCFRCKKLENITDFILEVKISSQCFEEEKLSDNNEPEIKNVRNDNIKQYSANTDNKWRKSVIKKDSDSDYSESDAGSDVGEGMSSTLNDSDGQGTSGIAARRQVPIESWTCARSSKNSKPNVNQAITEKLQEMIKTYESTNDKWRAFGYQKAVQAIKNHPKPITSWEEARNLRGVGAKLADKIWEIVESGELRKLNEFKSSDDIRVLNLFTDVWGAGPTTARTWYQQGFRTIEDLKTTAKLTSQQKVGVRLYDDLLDRMPRSEAGEIETVVRETAESLQPGIIAQACGSYRRGKATCGDVDILLTHPDGKSHRGVFNKLIAKLTDEGFLTDHLVTVEDSGNQKKYFGVCKLKGENKKHRRLDIIVIPYEEYGCALVYFTGSAHFNRSLRHLAKKMHMSLNEHALKYGVVRKGNEKIHDGTIIPTPTEKSVFEKFNIPYRPPEERDH